MALLSMDRVRAGFAADPSIYPQNLSLVRESILFLQLERGAIEAASFLDDRILSAHAEGRWVRFGDIAPLVAGLEPARPLHFIFHAGHVGSTLISRLLEEPGGVLGLREPLPLRVLAEAFDEASAPNALAGAEQVRTLLRWLTLLWARGYADTKSVIVKATSSAGRLSGELLGMLPQSRALYMSLRAEPYLATLLAGENSYLDLRGQGGERYRRLIALDAPPPRPLHAMSLGEIAALTWLAETLTQARAAAVHGDRILELDFDAFLADPGAQLRAISAQFELEAPESFFTQAPQSAIMQRYSKSPDRAYTPQLRAEILAEARKLRADEIRRGQLWLEAMAQRHPHVAAAL